VLPHVETGVDRDDLDRDLRPRCPPVPEGFTCTRSWPSSSTREALYADGEVDWAHRRGPGLRVAAARGHPVRSPARTPAAARSRQRHSVLSTTRPAPSTRRSPTSRPARQGKFWIYDSLLSEYAALGFEYGYSVDNPDALVMWEAQFGDFVNGAQIIIDQYIVAAEDKWGQTSGLVLLLPHGYEGQGPSTPRPASSASCTLRRGQHPGLPTPPRRRSTSTCCAAGAARVRKPLVVITPKQLLRLKAATSAVEDFTTGRFEPVLRDKAPLDGNAVTRVLLASARVVYDLEAERDKRQDGSTAILRVEQLYPVPAREIAEAVKAYPNAELVWCQDEPQNQGAWPFMAVNLPGLLAGRRRGAAGPGGLAARVGGPVDRLAQAARPGAGHPLARRFRPLIAARAGH
jgi:2-oxoglutarate decarboxylase